MTVDMAGLTPPTRHAFRDLQEAAMALGYTIEPRSARRTCAEQADLWNVGRMPGDTRQIVTHAQGCTSWHVTGHAVDFNVLRDGRPSSLSSDYTAVGQLAESLGWVWGGRFPGFGPNGDEGHVEWRYDADGRRLTLQDVCPNPSQCVDVPSTAEEDEDESLGVMPLAIGGIAVGATILGAIWLARR